LQTISDEARALLDSYGAGRYGPALREVQQRLLEAVRKLEVHQDIPQRILAAQALERALPDFKGLPEAGRIEARLRRARGP